MRRIGLGIALALVASACSNSQTSPAGRGERYVIAVIPKGTLHEFWKSVHAGALQAEKELGNVNIRWEGPLREDDREAQIQLVENYTNLEVNAIVLAPLDRRALSRPVEDASLRKIPVVIIDSAIDTKQITSYIATDNYNGGVIAARYMGKDLLKGKGNVIVLRYQTGSASTEQREKGFLETMKKEFPEIKILSENREAGATREGALAEAENLLTQFGDQINGWFCPCEPVTHGVWKAARNRKMLGAINIVGFDTGNEVAAALRKNEIQGLILQDPVAMGYQGVKTAVAAIEKKPVEPVVKTGETLVTPQNMNEPAIAKLLVPDLSILEESKPKKTDEE